MLKCSKLKYNKIKAPTKYKKHSDSAYLLILFKEFIFFLEKELSLFISFEIFQPSNNAA